MTKERSSGGVGPYRSSAIRRRRAAARFKLGAAVLVTALAAARAGRAQEPEPSAAPESTPATLDSTVAADLRPAAPDSTSAKDSTPYAGDSTAAAADAYVAPADDRPADADLRLHDGPPITLDEAVQRAIAVSPDVVRDVGAVTAAQAAERSALGSFLPSLFLSSRSTLSSTERFNPATDTSVSGTSTSYSAGLTSSLDLFTGGRRTAERRGARAEREGAEASLLADRFNVALVAKQTFFEALRQAELERVAENRVQRGLEGLSAATTRLAVGSATLSDSLRAQFELTDARVALLQAQYDRQSATFALGRLVGLDGPASPVPPVSLEPEPLPLSEDEIVELAVRAAPSVQQAEAQQRSGEAGVQAARADYLPTLSVGAGYDWFNQDLALDGGRTSWSGALLLSYPLFDRFQREENVARARAEARTAAAVVPDAQRAARAEAERLLVALRLSEQRIDLARENARVAEEDLRVQEERYRLASTTSLDRITSQVTVAQAEADLVAARYDYQLARAQLEALIGREL
jgi:outer membrane protein TolC